LRIRQTSATPRQFADVATPTRQPVIYAPPIHRYAI